MGALLCLFIYLPGLDAPFVWDDIVYLASNASLERTAAAKDFFGQEYFVFSKEASWRPLATLSYHIPVRLAGKSPAALRAPNLALHLLNALLLFALLRRLRLPPRIGFWAGALFLVHPAHTETLMCVTFNEEILAACGILAMLSAHVRGRTVWAAAAFACAALAKETGALGFGLAVLCDALLGGRRRCGQRRGAYAVYGAVLAAYVWLRFVHLEGPGVEAGLSAALPFAERAFYGAAGLITALRVFILPFGLRMEYFALPVRSAGEALLWAAGGAAFAASSVVLWRRFKDDRPLLFFLIWPFVFLAVTSNILPFNLLSLRYMAERWLYIPYMGMMVVLAFYLAKRPSAAVVLLVVWSAGAGVRVRDWRDGARLWESLVRVYPWSAKAQEGLGEAYFSAGRHARARRVFERALALRTGGVDRVLEHYAALSGGILRRETPSLYRWLGRSYLKEGDLARADESFSRSAALDPADGYAYRIMAYHYALAGRFPEARRWSERGTERFPRDAVLLRLKRDIDAGRLSFRAAF